MNLMQRIHEAFVILSTGGTSLVVGPHRVDNKRKTWTPAEAQLLLCENLRATSPDPEILALIEKLEREARDALPEADSA